MKSSWLGILKVLTRYQLSPYGVKVLLGFLGFQSQPLECLKMRAVPERHAEQPISRGETSLTGVDLQASLGFQ